MAKTKLKKTKSPIKKRTKRNRSQQFVAGTPPQANSNFPSTSVGSYSRSTLSSSPPMNAPGYPAAQVIGNPVPGPPVVDECVKTAASPTTRSFNGLSLLTFEEWEAFKFQDMKICKVKNVGIIATRNFEGDGDIYCRSLEIEGIGHRLMFPSLSEIDSSYSSSMLAFAVKKSLDGKTTHRIYLDLFVNIGCLSSEDGSKQHIIDHLMIGVDIPSIVFEMITDIAPSITQKQIESKAETVSDDYADLSINNVNDL